MTTALPQSFPAQRYSAALGRKRQWVQKRLENVPYTETLIRGVPAREWPVDALPEDMTQQLEAIRKRRGFPSIPAMLAEPEKPWEPESPLRELEQSCIDDALAKQRAFTPLLIRLTDSTLTQSERERLGLELYAKHVGHKISASHWWNLYDRIVDRDRGAQRWERVELFLGTRLKRKISPALLAGPHPADPAFARDLVETINATIQNPGTSTIQERAIYFWHLTFLLFEEQTADGKAPKKLKRALVAVLHRRASFMGATLPALAKSFGVNYQRWIANGRRPWEDGRPSKSGFRRGPDLSSPDFEASRLLLIAAASKFGGGVSQAWREMHAEIDARITSWWPDKFKCPRKVQDWISSDAKKAKACLNPRRQKLNGPYSIRDPMTGASGSWDQSDDLTAPNLFWDELPTGEIWCGQGQFLAWVDERSWFIYGFVLIPDKAYNAFHIRNSWKQKCREWGLPREGLYLENGIWRRSRLIGGVDWSETEMGIRQFGLRIQHAIYPKGKIIERIFNTYQNLLSSEVGYVGRSPHTDKYENTYKQLRLVQSGDEHPSKFFYSKHEWTERLTELVHKYNGTPGRGKYLNGLTPKQAFEEHYTEPLIKIPAQLERYLASHKRPVSLGRNGISFSFGKHEFTYTGRRTGELPIDWEGIAFFDPEDPDTCAFTDADGKNPFVLPKAPDLPLHDAPADLLEADRRRIRDHESYSKELYATLKPIFAEHFSKRQFRPAFADAEAVETGRIMRKETKRVSDEQKEGERRAARGRKAYRKLNIPVTETHLRRPGTVEHAQNLARLLAEEEPGPEALEISEPSQDS
jgi:hypothetical protein